MSLKPKHQRLVLAISALVALIGAVLLAMWGLRDRAAYFVTPTDIAAGAAKEGDALRLGGMVKDGSLKQLDDGVTLRFVVTDGKEQVETRFQGIPPSLFKEGSGVVAEGRLRGGVFEADNILAKHDERYMPPQLGNSVAEHAAGQTVEK